MKFEAAVQQASQGSNRVARKAWGDQGFVERNPGGAGEDVNGDPTFVLPVFITTIDSAGTPFENEVETITAVGLEHIQSHLGADDWYVVD